MHLLIKIYGFNDGMYDAMQLRTKKTNKKERDREIVKELLHRQLHSMKFNRLDQTIVRDDTMK